MSKSTAIYNLRLPAADLAVAYISLWQGALGLTEKEVELLAIIALRDKELSGTVTDEALKAELLLSSGFRAELREKLGISPNNLQNYLKSLRDKGALTSSSGRDWISHKLTLKEVITFTFTEHE